MDYLLIIKTVNSIIYEIISDKSRELNYELISKIATLTTEQNDNKLTFIKELIMEFFPVIFIATIRKNWTIILDLLHDTLDINYNNFTNINIVSFLGLNNFYFDKKFIMDNKNCRVIDLLRRSNHKEIHDFMQRYKIEK